MSSAQRAIMRMVLEGKLLYGDFTVSNCDPALARSIYPTYDMMP